jgi:hypothetical protein
MMAVPTDAQRKANLKAGWALAAVAALFGLAFLAKIVLVGG